MICIEGPDAVGKTTFAKKLLKLINERTKGRHVYAHFTRLPEGFDSYWGYIERASRFIVQDRFHMSEVTYAPARGDIPRICPETYRLVDAKLRSLGAFTVLIVSDPDLVEERCDDTQMFNKEQNKAVAEIYQTIAITKVLQLPGAKDIYEPDIDYIITTNRVKPYATEDDAERIVDLYFNRQSVLTSTAHRCPGSV